MCDSLAWQLLSASDVAALATADIAASARIILDADAARARDAKHHHPRGDATSPAVASSYGAPYAAYFQPPLITNETQKYIVLDAVFHLLRFARASGLTDVKQSALASLFLSLHRTSMEEGLTLEGSFARATELLTQHAVHRPPYCVAVFDVEDVRRITDYLAASYFRFYGLYVHAFTRRREMTVVTRLLGDHNEVPPSLPPLQGAMPLEAWQRQEAEALRQRTEEEQRRMAAIAEQQRRREEAERRRVEAEEEANREVPAGLRAQLGGIRAQISRASLENLALLEAKVAAIEARVLADGGALAASGGAHDGTKPSSGGSSKRTTGKR